jgi:biopolymer transport protein ExbB/TolQ
LIRYVRSKREVHRIQRCKDWKEIGDSPLNNHIEKVRDMLARDDAEVAFSHAECFAQRQREDTQRAYDVINFLVCSLPALGLFGTMLGLSGALSAAFSEGSLGSDSIKTFVSSLGTALDTTVLALGCAMVAGSTAWLLNRMENLLLQQQTAVIHAVSGLDGFNLQLNADRPASSRDTRDLDIAETVRTEVQALLAENVAKITSRFDGCLEGLEELARMSVERSAQSNSIDGQGINRANLAEAITSCLDNAMERIGELIITHNGDAIKNVTSALNRFAGAIDERIPRELVISYNRNGDGELNHVA